MRGHVCLMWQCAWGGSGIHTRHKERRANAHKTTHMDARYSVGRVSSCEVEAGADGGCKKVCWCALCNSVWLLVTDVRSGNGSPVSGWVTCNGPSARNRRAFHASVVGGVGTQSSCRASLHLAAVSRNGLTSFLIRLMLREMRLRLCRLGQVPLNHAADVRHLR